MSLAQHLPPTGVREPRIPGKGGRVMRSLVAIVLSLAVVSLGLGPMPALAAGDKSPSAAVAEKGEKMTLEQVPPAVKTTIEKEAKGGSVVDVVKETAKGKTSYEAHIMKDGKD